LTLRHPMVPTWPPDSDLGRILCQPMSPTSNRSRPRSPLPAQRQLALDAFMKVVAINLGGTVNVAAQAAAVMQSNDPVDDERGVIVNTASVAGYEGQIGQVAYAASKGGVIALTLPLARELAGSLIRVMTIAPGVFETPMMAGLPKEAQDSLGGKTPHPRRLGRPEEFAVLVEHIVENPMLNGETIRLDGALRLEPR
jgi:NAD(P)-dependent dehydrogenase (short-subunit alcohol dehydrogenase family)